MAHANPKVLIVDDDAFIRDIVALILESCDYPVEYAESGEEALRRCISTPDIDLIVSDLNMPGISGLDLLRELRASSINVPVILLTGSDEADRDPGARPGGPIDWVLKDENLQDNILASVQGALVNRRRTT